MWLYTKAVVCNEQEPMQNYRLLKFRSVMKAVNWVCDNALDEHMKVSELTISCQEAKVLEALQYDLGVLDFRRVSSSPEFTSFLLSMCIDAPESTTNSHSSNCYEEGAGKTHASVRVERSIVLLLRLKDIFRQVPCFSA